MGGTGPTGETPDSAVDDAFFRAAVTKASTAMVAIDAAQAIVFVNDAACRMFQTTADALLGRSLRQLIAPASWPLPDPLPAAIEISGQGPDGSQLPLELSMTRVESWRLITLRDISSRSALRTVIENMPGAISMFGPDLKMRACNSKLRQMLDFPETLFADGLPSLADLFRFNAERGEYGPGDIEEMVANRLEQARHPTPHVFERARADGTVLEIRGAPLKAGGFVTIYTDVTARHQAEEALKTAMAESERTHLHLRSVIEHLPQGVTVIDSNLDVVVWNSAFTRLLGIPDTVMPPGQVVPYATAIRYVAQRGDYGPGDPEEQVRQRVELASRFEEHRFERTLPDGTVIEVAGRPMRDGGFVTTYTDITDIRRSAQRLAQTLDLMDEVLAHAVIAVFELDHRGCFRFARGLGRVIGLDDRSALGHSILDLFAERERPRVHALVDGSLGHPIKGALARRRDDGREVWLALSGYSGCDVDGMRGDSFRGVLIDVTDKHMADLKIEELIDRLEQSALHDPLTGLANRTKFLQRFEEEVDRQRRSGKPLALVAMDLDHFKQVNDRFGHLTGDMVLRETAKTLRAAVRQTDLVARFGGEEFLVLLPETDGDGAVRVAENLRRLVAEQVFRLPGNSERLHVTATFGIAQSPATAPLSLDSLLEAADQAAYRGKHQGRNRVCVA